MNDLISWAGGLVVAIMALVASWLAAKRQGRNEEKQRQQEADRKAKETAQEVADEIANLDGDDLLDRASKWVRKSR